MSDGLPAPITREDRYLACLCGTYSGDLPTPITREERYLALLAETNGVGGGVSVCGCNLLPGSRDLSGNRTKSYITENTYQGLTIAHHDNTDADASVYVSLLEWPNVIIPEPDTYYTLSFWAKGTGEALSFFYPSAIVSRSGKNDSGNTNTSTDGNITTALNEDWTRHWITWKTLSDVSGAKSVIPARLYSGNECYICGVKLEQGNTPTDWTPAPEDGELPIPITRTDRYLAYWCGVYDGDLPSPITRKDYYLAALCGTYDGDLPNPITRADYYLHQLAQT